MPPDREVLTDPLLDLTAALDEIGRVMDDLHSARGGIVHRRAIISGLESATKAVEQLRAERMVKEIRQAPREPKITGIRVALQHVVFPDQLGEIFAADAFIVPEGWTHIWRLETRWSGRRPDGSLTLAYGPDFDFLPPATS